MTHKTSSLAGRCILNTRPKNNQAEFTSLLEKHGARVFTFETFEINPTPSSEIQVLINRVGELSEKDWVFFTSANGVVCTMRAIDKACKERIQKSNIAVIGEKTAEQARLAGLTVSFVATTSNSKSFAEEFLKFSLDKLISNDAKMVLFRAGAASSVLPEMLKSAGFSVFPITVYDSVTKVVNEREVNALKENLNKFDLLTFTSAEAARSMLKIMNSWEVVFPKNVQENFLSIPTAVIGPTTAKAVRGLGFNLQAVSPLANVPSLTSSIINYLNRNINY
jgi:uroporphyrinogen-III synthase